MIHLVYRFRPTAKARADLGAFWRWIADRQLWFYDGLDMILETKWYTVTIGVDVHCLEHHVTFADEAAWGRYRREISEHSREPEWEARRISQEEWFEMLDARILTNPPIPIPLPASAGPASAGPVAVSPGAVSPVAVSPATATGEGEAENARLVERSRFLLDNARFVTLATQGADGPWASTVNYVPLSKPLRLLWYSARDARHSVNVADRPRISASIFLTGLTGEQAPGGLPLDGAQFTGVARETPIGELAELYDRYYELNFPDPVVREQWKLPLSEFRDDGPRRFYTLTVDQWWLLDADRWVLDKYDTRVGVPVEWIGRG